MPRHANRQSPQTTTTTTTLPPQFHPMELYPAELDVQWEEIAGCFQREFVPKLQASSARGPARCLPPPAVLHLP